MDDLQRAPESRASAELRLEVNGEPQTVEGPCTIAGLLARLDLGGKRVAVAVNRGIVVRSRYAEIELASGDRVEILEAVGGG